MANFKDITSPELLARKGIIDSEIETLRIQILKDLDKLEVLCKEGQVLTQELKERENVS